MCSRSMLVITATVGYSTRNDRSLSSASATRYSPRPSRALLPKAESRPPITAVGSTPARSSTTAIIDVVVVLPCEPATAIENRSRISSASISARGMTGMPRRVASTTSGFEGRTADDTTTTCASPMFSALCPSCTRTPNFSASRFATADRFTSDPLTSNPRLARSSAIPLMPIPPMPTKWIRRVLPSKLDDPIHDHLRRVRPGQPPRRGAYRRAFGVVARQCHDLRRKQVAGQRSLVDHSRRTVVHQRFRVLPLVVVGGGRQRNQDRRPPRRGQLRERGRAGTADDEIRLFHLAVDGVEKRLDAGLESRARVTVADHFQIPFARLMRNRQTWCGGNQPRCCLHHGHVDRVRALRAAKD